MEPYLYDEKDANSYFRPEYNDYPTCSRPGHRGMNSAAANLQDPQFYRTKFKLNSFKYRCDEFTDVHEKKHILFAGCSVAYGDGSDLEDTWAKQIYNKISTKEDVGGYYNIGSNGASPMEIIDLVFRYVNKYGKPDVIFIGFPEFYRDISEKDMTDGLSGKQAVWFDKMLTWLEGMCNANNIQLYMFRWNHAWDERKDVINNYRTHRSYLHYENLDAMRFSHKYSDEHNGESWLLTGWDDGHPGKAFHAFWYNMLYEEYARRNEIND